MQAINSLTDLETRGFCVIKNFFEEHEIKLLQHDYTTTLADSNKNYNISIPSNQTLSVIIPRLDRVISQVTQTTNIVVDTYTNEAMYTDTNRIKFDWHQDHESFYVLQQSYNYINCYIPVIKTDKDLGGVSLIAMDFLKEYHPSFFDKIFNKGAQQVNKEHLDTLRIYNAETNDTYRYQFDIESAATSPELEERDLLLIRGDVIHKTQDTNQYRVALSIRYADGSCLIDKNKLFGMTSKKKKEMIMNNKKRYEKLHNTFTESGQQILSFGELMKRNVDN
jgi:hypothetical protein